MSERFAQVIWWLWVASLVIGGSYASYLLVNNVWYGLTHIY